MRIDPESGTLAPVVLFAYNRPLHTAKTIEALAENDLAPQSDLYVFSDGNKGQADRQLVADVRAHLSAVADRGQFRSVQIFEADHNDGLANSVIRGVSHVIDATGRVIVLEDDHVTGPDFLSYMNHALTRYGSDPRVWSISGYTPPITLPSDYDQAVYFTHRGSSWGYATWLDRWEQVDWSVSDYDVFRGDRAVRKRLNRGGRDMAGMLDLQMQGRIDSWAIRWCYAQSKLDALTVYPVHSVLQNTGLDGSGTHSGFANRFTARLGTAPKYADLCEPFLDARVLKSFRNIYGSAARVFAASGARNLRHRMAQRATRRSRGAI